MSDQAFKPVPVGNFSMASVESSMIAEAGYNSDLYMLQIRFKPKSGDSIGPLYQYLNVSWELWELLLRAESIGKEFTRLIKNKPRHPCVQVIEKEDDQ